MNRVAISILLASVCACHKHEDAAARVEPVATTVASPAPSASASPDTIGSAEIQQMVGMLNAAASADPTAERMTFGFETAQADAGNPFGDNGLGLRHVGHAPSTRQGSVTVLGRLAPEVIKRVVRRNFSHFRYCYEKGLVANPNLAGTVATKFVIDPKGNVTTASRDAATTMTDAGVVSCVTGVFSSLSFPEPEGGIVVVTYPLIFAPAD